MTTHKHKKLPANKLKYVDGVPYCGGCGEIQSDHRSLKHLGLLFVFVAYLFKHWDGLVASRKALPDFKEEDIDRFVPISPEHLRAWLLVQTSSVRPYVVQRFETRLEQEISLKTLERLYESLRARRIYGWPQQIEGGIAVLEPISVAVYGDERMSETDFCDVTRKVFDFVYAKLRVDIQHWKETHRKGSDD